MEDLRTCKHCKKPMVLVTSSQNPKANEWHCVPCHYSEYVDDEPGTPSVPLSEKEETWQKKQ